MSAKYTYRAIEYNPGNPIKKLILIVMADIADDQGCCFPSNKTIAERCGASTSTVKSHIKELSEAGIIVKQERYKEGSQTSNMFKLCLPMTDWECRDTPAENRLPPSQILTTPQPESDHESTQLTYSIKKTTESVVSLYHEILPEMPRVEKITSKREKSIMARHKGDFNSDIENWRGYFEYIRDNCKWVMGKREGKKQNSIDLLIREDTVVSVMEGQFNDR